MKAKKKAAVWTEEEVKLRELVKAGQAVVCNLSDNGPHKNLVKWAKDSGKFAYIAGKTWEGWKQSKWHNPYIRLLKKGHSREAVMAMYRESLLANKELLKQLPELKGKVLGCWCRPLACHGDVLLELLVKGEKVMAPQKTKRAFHYTCSAHIRPIFESGFIMTTESNIKEDGSGPPVVWLTLNPNPAEMYVFGNMVDKGEFRFTVEVPEKDLHYWPVWSNKQGISKAWYDRLATMGNPREWYIVQYPISTDNIKRLENTRTGEVLLDLE